MSSESGLMKMTSPALSAKIQKIGGYIAIGNTL